MTTARRSIQPDERIRRLDDFLRSWDEEDDYHDERRVTVQALQNSVCFPRGSELRCVAGKLLTDNSQGIREWPSRTPLIGVRRQPSVGLDTGAAPGDGRFGVLLQRGDGGSSIRVGPATERAWSAAGEAAWAVLERIGEHPGRPHGKHDLLVSGVIDELLGNKTDGVDHPSYGVAFFADWCFHYVGIPLPQTIIATGVLPGDGGTTGDRVGRVEDIQVKVRAIDGLALGVGTVIVPSANRAELEESFEVGRLRVRRDLEILFADRPIDVLRFYLQRSGDPRAAAVLARLEGKGSPRALPIAARAAVFLGMSLLALLTLRAVATEPAPPAAAATVEPAASCPPPPAVSCPPQAVLSCPPLAPCPSATPAVAQRPPPCPKPQCPRCLK